MQRFIFTVLITLGWSIPDYCPSIISSSSVPFTITASGRYLVSDNVAYTAASSTPIITISTDNVVLDMLNYTVTQVGGFGFSVTGIQITQGVSNVRIINGIVNNCTQAGVSIAAGCNNISLNGILVTDCGNRGIEFMGTPAAPIIESTINNCSLTMNCTTPSADNVLTLSNASYTIVQDTTIDLNGSGVITGTFACIRVTGLRNQFLNITMNDGLGNRDARGLSLNNADQTLVRLCTVNNLTATGGGATVAAFLCEANTTSTANQFQNCIARACSGVLAVDGFLSSTGCDDNVFDTCLSHMNQASATNGTAHGFRAINNNRNNFLYCRARRNVATASTVAAPLYGAWGFKMDTTTGATCVQCLAEDHLASTRAVGFGLIGPNSDNVFWQNIAARNQTFGFDSIMSQAAYANQVFVQNLAITNPAAGGAQYSTTGATAGFPAAAKNDSITAQTLNTISPSAWTNVGIA
jgi:hypothetical protein